VDFIKELLASNRWMVCIHSYEQPKAFKAGLERYLIGELLRLPVGSRKYFP
jgi:hypothetical protein